MERWLDTQRLGLAAYAFYTIPQFLRSTNNRMVSVGEFDAVKNLFMNYLETIMSDSETKNAKSFFTTLPPSVLYLLNKALSQEHKITAKYRNIFTLMQSGVNQALLELNSKPRNIYQNRQVWVYYIMLGETNARNLIQWGQELFKIKQHKWNPQGIDVFEESLDVLRNPWSETRERCVAVERLVKILQTDYWFDCQIENLLYQYQFYWPLFVLQYGKTLRPLACSLPLGVDLHFKKQTAKHYNPNYKGQICGVKNEELFNSWQKHIDKATKTSKILWKAKRGNHGALKYKVLASDINFDFGVTENILELLIEVIYKKTARILSFEGSSAEAYLSQAVLNRLIGGQPMLGTVITGEIGDQKANTLNYEFVMPGGLKEKMEYVSASKSWERFILPSRLTKKFPSKDYDNNGKNLNENIRDLEPPELDLDSIYVGPNKVCFGDLVYFEASVSVICSGIRSIEVRYLLPSGKSETVFYKTYGTGHRLVSFEFTSMIKTLHNNGSWKMQDIILMDHEGNKKHYNRSDYPMFEQHDFAVYYQKQGHHIEVLQCNNLENVADIAQIEGWRQYKYIRCPEAIWSLQYIHHRRVGDGIERPGLLPMKSNQVQNVLNNLMDNTYSNVLKLGHVSIEAVATALWLINNPLREKMTPSPPMLWFSFIRATETEQDIRFWQVVWQTLGASKNDFYKFIQLTSREEIVAELAYALDRLEPKEEYPSHRAPDIMVIVDSQHFNTSHQITPNNQSRPFMVEPILEELNRHKYLGSAGGFHYKQFEKLLGHTRIIILSDDNLDTENNITHNINNNYSMDENLNSNEIKKIFDALSIFRWEFNLSMATLVISHVTDKHYSGAYIRNYILKPLVEMKLLKYVAGRYFIPPELRYAAAQDNKNRDIQNLYRYHYAAGLALTPYAEIWKNTTLNFPSLALDYAFQPAIVHEAQFHFNLAIQYGDIMIKNDAKKCLFTLSLLNELPHWGSVKVLTDLNILGSAKEAYNIARKILRWSKKPPNSPVHPRHLLSTVSAINVWCRSFVSHPEMHAHKMKRLSHLVELYIKKALLNCQYFHGEENTNYMLVLSNYSIYLAKNEPHRRSLMEFCCREVLAYLKNGGSPKVLSGFWFELAGDLEQNDSKAVEIYIMGTQHFNWGQLWIKGVGAAKKAKMDEKISEIIDSIDEEIAIVINGGKRQFENNYWWDMENQVAKRIEAGMKTLDYINIDKITYTQNKHPLDAAVYALQIAAKGDEQYSRQCLKEAKDMSFHDPALTCYEAVIEMIFGHDELIRETVNRLDDLLHNMQNLYWKTTITFLKVAGSLLLGQTSSIQELIDLGNNYPINNYKQPPFLGHLRIGLENQKRLNDSIIDLFSIFSPSPISPAFTALKLAAEGNENLARGYINLAKQRGLSGFACTRSEAVIELIFGGEEQIKEIVVYLDNLMVQNKLQVDIYILSFFLRSVGYLILGHTPKLEYVHRLFNVNQYLPEMLFSDDNCPPRLDADWKIPLEPNYKKTLLFLQKGLEKQGRLNDEINNYFKCIK